MDRLISSRKLRFLLLRFSSLQLASVVLASLSVIFFSLWFVDSQHAWLFLVLLCLGMIIILLLLRAAPSMWHDISRYRQPQERSRLACLPNYVSWQTRQQDSDTLYQQARDYLAGQHYATAQLKLDNRIVLSAMKGRLNRVGFILVHAAAVLILLGLLLDSELFLQFQLAGKQLQPGQADKPLHEITSESRIPSRSSMAFEGHEQLYSGQITDEVRVRIGNGILARSLPFAIAIHAVELDPVQSLQEDNFLTRISILDPRLDRPVQAVLGSNRPFRYRGLSYYQSAVLDGGSELDVAMWPMAHASSVPLKFRTHVGTERELQTRDGTIRIRFSNLKPRNVLQLQAGAGAGRKFKNAGPSLYYTVSDFADTEREFINYMLPVIRNGRYFYISAYRNSPKQDFSYIHIPVDRDGGLDRFIELHAALFDPAKLDFAINRVLQDAVKSTRNTGHEEFRKTLSDLIELFRQGGFSAVNESIMRRAEPAAQQQSMRISYKLIRSMLYALYNQNMGKTRLDETDLLYFEDAFPELSRMAEANMPIYIQLNDMVFKPVVHLQVSYRPGATLFYGGCLLLLIGMGLMFYTYYRRIWLVLGKEDDANWLVMAGMSSRHKQQFSGEFKRLSGQLQQKLGA